MVMGIEDEVLGALALGLTALMFVTRSSILGFPCVIFWGLFGAYAYTQSAATWDLYYLLFIASLLGMVPFTALAAYALREGDVARTQSDIDAGAEEPLGTEEDDDDGFSEEEKPKRAKRKRTRKTSPGEFD